MNKNTTTTANEDVYNNVNTVQSGNNLSEKLNIITKKITNKRKFTERWREMPFLTALRGMPITQCNSAF